MKPGDRVRLTVKVATTAMKGYSGMRRRTPVNWHARRGTIARINRTAVCVQWDDINTPDLWPPSALQVMP